MSVGTLPSMPRAEGLFRRAIAQSGAAHHVISAATAQRVVRRLAGTRSRASREAIATVPVDRLLQAQAELDADLAAHPDPQLWGGDVAVSMMLWQPVIDGYVIPARPIDRIAAGAAVCLPGSLEPRNRGEADLYLLAISDSVSRRLPYAVTPLFLLGCRGLGLATL
jgi:carboxylesterase type B